MIFKNIALAIGIISLTSANVGEFGLSGEHIYDLYNSNINTASKNYFNDSYYKSQWQIEALSLEKAWNIYKKGKTIKIAILDSGIDLNSDEIKYCLNINKSENFNNNVSSAFATYDANNLEYSTHGIGVSSIIAAKQNNNKGIAGIINNVELYSFRVFDNKGHFPSDYNLVADAINRCSELGIDIINLSGHFTSDNLNIKNAIKNFSGLFVCSAGNDNIDISNKNYFPAKWKLDNVLVVGNMDENYKRYIGEDGSNYSNTYVDVFAPGERVAGLTFNDQLKGYGGTSFATPMVTGIAALYLSEHYGISANKLKSKIIESVKKTSEFSTICTSGGRVDAFSLLNNHDYNNKYNYVDTLTHEEVCLCGEKIKVGHTVAGGSFSGGNRYAKCLICGGNAEMGFTSTVSLNNSLIEFELINGLYYVKETCLIDNILNLSYEDFLNYEKE